MQFTLNTHPFDLARTTAIETYEEIGGRTTRTVRLQGVLEGFTSRAALEAALDALLNAASAPEPASLSLRPGRRLWVRRTGFRREILREPLAGAFKLDLEAVQPREEALAATQAVWNIEASGATQLLGTVGNTPAAPVLQLTAIGTLVDPAISDGARTLQYSGVLEDGDVLIIDGTQRRVTRNGEDVTPYTTGLFPRIAPPATALTYTGAFESTHTATIHITYRDLWW